MAYVFVFDLTCYESFTHIKALRDQVTHVTLQVTLQVAWATQVLTQVCFRRCTSPGTCARWAWWWWATSGTC